MRKKLDFRRDHNKKQKDFPTDEEYNDYVGELEHINCVQFIQHHQKERTIQEGQS